MPKPLRTWISNIIRLERIALFAFVILILTVAGGAWKLAKHLDKQDADYFADVPNLNISSYSLSGKVTRIEPDEIELEVGQVVSGPNGNTIEYQKYTAQIQQTTAILKRNAENKLDPALTKDILVGNEITVYTSENPYNTKSVFASKIELN